MPSELSDLRRQLREQLQASGVMRRLAATEKAVLLQYLKRMDLAGEAWPNAPMLVDEIGCSVGHAKRARAGLVSVGLLQPVGDRLLRGRRVVVYRLPLEAEALSSALNALVSRQARRRASATGRGALPVAPGATGPGAPSAPCGGVSESYNGAAGVQAHPDAPPPRSLARGNPEPDKPKEPPHLFDAAAAVQLLVEARYDGRAVGWQDDAADARDLVERYGPEAVRRVVDDQLWRARTGRMRSPSSQFRGAVVAALRDGEAGIRWQGPPNKPKPAADVAAAEQRRKAAEERRRAELQAAEERDELLWSQLPESQRVALRAEILARIGTGNVLARLDHNSRTWRGRILDELKRRQAS